LLTERPKMSRYIYIAHLYEYRLIIISSTNFNAQFNNNMYVTLLSSTCFGP